MAFCIEYMIFCVGVDVQVEHCVGVVNAIHHVHMLIVIVFF